MSTPVLAHVSAGEGPPVVLLNGGLMSFAAWDEVAAPLQQRFQVVRCDFRGQLRSPGTPPPTLLGHADDVAALLDHLSLAGAHLVGASFGALVGLTLAAAHPTRVRSLVAMNATDRFTPDIRAAGVALREAAEAAAAGGDGGRVFDLVALGTFSREYRERHMAALAARRAAIVALPREWFAGLVGLLAAIEDLDLSGILPQVGCRTLVLGGGRDETFPLWHSQSLAAALPHARLRIVPNGSHGMLLESPAVVLESLVEFLDEVEGAAPAGDTA
jgi:pimeloyl-ACP methyl ester carboxylesterase